MSNKYVLQEFMQLDYSDDLLTEEEREGNRQGTHLIVAGKFKLPEKRMATDGYTPDQFLKER